MKQRKSIPKKHSKKVFTKGAQRTHKKNNLSDRPMRGGIRL